MSFSRIEEIKLIKSVKHYSALYDPRDKEYKESRKRRKMWDDIASHFKGRTGKYKKIGYLFVYLNESRLYI